MKKKIILIDENPVFRFLLDQYLSDRFDVRIYKVADNLIHDLTGTSPLPDLIIMDHKQKLLSGIGLEDVLKTDAHTAEIPRICLMRNPEETCRPFANQLCILKPFFPSDLMKLINELLKF